MISYDVGNLSTKHILSFKRHAPGASEATVSGLESLLQVTASLSRLYHASSELIIPAGMSCGKPRRRGGVPPPGGKRWCGGRGPCVLRCLCGSATSCKVNPVNERGALMMMRHGVPPGECSTVSDRLADFGAQEIHLCIAACERMQPTSGKVNSLSPTYLQCRNDSSP